MKTFTRVLILSALSLLVACAAGPCKENKDTPHQPLEATLPMNEIKPTDRVKVFKPDGSLQCGQGKAIPVEEMKKQLQGITVYSAANKPDGLMHIQACGTPTGQCNVYEIDRSSLEKAKSVGFREWTFE